MRRFLTTLAVAILTALPAFSQTTGLTTLTATHISQDASLTPLAAGKICLVLVDANGRVTGFTAGNGGQVLPEPLCYTVTAGSIGTGVSVADTSLAQPSGIGYQVQVISASGQVLYNYPQAIYPSGSTWSFDSWSPTVSTPVVSGSAISFSAYAPQGRCGTAPRITYTATTTYVCVGQVWQALSGSGSSAFTGGTLTQPLTLSTNPTSPLQAATKSYVDTATNALLPLSGGSMTGMLSLYADPTLPMHAVTKQYADALVSAGLVNGLIVNGGQTQTGVVEIDVPPPGVTSISVNGGAQRSGDLALTIPPSGVNSLAVNGGSALKGDISLTIPSAPTTLWTSNNSTNFGGTNIYGLGTQFVPGANGASISQVNLALSTAGVGCTTLPVVTLYDTTTSSSVTEVSTSFEMSLANGSRLFSYVPSTPYALTANHTYMWGIITAASGCSTNPAGPNWTVTYTQPGNSTGSSAKTAAPVFSRAAGTYSAAISTTISDATSGATIQWCYVGSGTCTPSTAYSSAVYIGASETLCANATAGGVTSSTTCNSYVIGSGPTYVYNVTNSNDNLNLSKHAVYNGTGTWAGVDSYFCIPGNCFGSSSGTPGGSSQPTSVTNPPIFSTISNPPTGLSDTTGMLLQMTTASNAGSQGTNILWVEQYASTNATAGACNNTCTTFVDEFWFLTDANLAKVHNFEHDNYIYLKAENLEFMSGWQFNQVSGKIQIDNAADPWQDTTAPSMLSPNTWYHVITTTHRVIGETACTLASGAAGPCIHYDSIQIEGGSYGAYGSGGTTYQINTTMRAAVNPYNVDQLGDQHQIDVDASKGAVTVSETIAGTHFRVY